MKLTKSGLNIKSLVLDNTRVSMKSMAHLAQNTQVFPALKSLTVVNCDEIDEDETRALFRKTKRNCKLSFEEEK